MGYVLRVMVGVLPHRPHLFLSMPYICLPFLSGTWSGGGTVYYHSIILWIFIIFRIENL